MPNHRADRHAATRRRPLDVRGTAGRGLHRAAARPLDTGAPGSSGADAARPSGAHRRRLLRLASAPALLAAGALVLAAVAADHPVRPDAAASAVGAVSGAGATPGAPARTAPDVSGASGVLAAGVVTEGALDRRERAVSRDANREARASAAGRRLQAATEKAAERRSAALAELAAAARREAARVVESRWQLPVAPGVYHLTSRFGACSALWSSCHTGLDFAAPEGTPLLAVAAGTVTEVGYAGAYGNRTIVTLQDGTEMWYCHQSTTTVGTGDRVVAGQVVGAVGSTGNTTGPHLHLEVRPRPDDPVDPHAALVSHGLRP